MFESIAQDIHHQQIQYKNIHITIKRLDQIHPQISGNKFFKLKYNFLAAKASSFDTVLTFGGAYSNHIAATAYAAHLFNFKSIGIIRGEELVNKALNPTLATAQQLGMQLIYVSREKYRLKNQPNTHDKLLTEFPTAYVIPEGGTNHLAIKGCKEILSDHDQHHYDVICCPVGTGGTIAGLIESSSTQQKVIGFSALKGDFLTHDVANWTAKSNWEILDTYCCGGYAKTSAELIAFIKLFEDQYHIPLEQVYTAKMMMGIFDLIDQNYFAVDSKILVIHTGGLQGKLPLNGH
ncbi:1-aminocyclopropane-1-carboxylate deaminase/D-cysteine desulfhydrase [Acinetobacter sp. 194]|uniref:1-aminocyclopropane-1-carboxylate deaminase/D-cysteine desulfhydrase n=1 Tax=Acinetobacter shaoyimingii TaxID=2715164 RepID=UPI00140B0045|nr:pyridoxal-phosphate dependent enzyme [Acinetobacter shaoyimingii]NHB57589.1 1-aminocyclopropane-1-carboxylate deaminase/D-cysteine desulfhydrase [Acinetobacter shaoyimingii]